MMDELDTVARFNDQVPEPSGNARAAARSRLDTAFAAERSHSRPAGAHRVRHPAVTWRLAAGVAAVAIVAALVISQRFGGQQSGLPSGLRRAILTAYEGKSDSILHVHQIRNSPSGPGDVTEMWSALASGPSGQVVRTRQLTSSADGAPLQDFAITQTLPGGRGPGVAPAVDVTIVDYSTHTWSHNTDGSAPIPPGATPDAIAIGSLQRRLEEGKWSELGPTTLSGEQTIEVEQHNPPGGRTLDVWVDAQTYLPVQEVFTYAGGSVTSSVGYLPATPANEGALNVTVPSEFTETASG
jgi:hypothetical protein